MGKSSANTALQQWCEDHLHHLLGFADSALASYLVHIAKSAEAQHSFCQSLYQKSRCCSNSRRDINITSSKGRTNADWINMAKNYSMLDDEDEQQKTDQINRKEKESPFSSTDETKSRKKIDSISRSRRHRSAQEDDDGDDDKRKNACELAGEKTVMTMKNLLHPETMSRRNQWKRNENDDTRGNDAETLARTINSTSTRRQ
jgi:hypothetical protein